MNEERKDFYWLRIAGLAVLIIAVLLSIGRLLINEPFQAHALAQTHATAAPSASASQPHRLDPQASSANRRQPQNRLRLLNQSEVAFRSLTKEIGNSSEASVIHGHRLAVKDYALGYMFYSQVFHAIADSNMVDHPRAMILAVKGLDGSTTAEGVAECRAKYIGKYMELSTPAFQIVVDRDYPRTGSHQFDLLGTFDIVSGVNVLGLSAEPIPPYYKFKMIGKIVDFRQSTNRIGDPIVVPVVKILLAFNELPYPERSYELIINDPVLIENLLRSAPKPPLMPPP